MSSQLWTGTQVTKTLAVSTGNILVNIFFLQYVFSNSHLAEKNNLHMPKLSFSKDTRSPENQLYANYQASLFMETWEK